MENPLPARWESPGHLRRTFNLLVLYRWLSLIPPLISLAVSPSPRNGFPPVGVLLAAIASNLLITLAPAWLNRWLSRWPPLLVLDLGFCAALVALSGGSQSPYYLLTFSPLLAAALFFNVPGALATAAGASVFFAAAILVSGRAFEWATVLGQMVSFFLIGGVFGYQPTLLTRLTSTRGDLERAHRDLEVIHELTLSLQSAADVNEVEQRVLDAVTGDLGFPSAVIGLVDQNDQVVTAWLGKARDGQVLFAGGLPHPARVSLGREGGVVAQSLQDGEPRLAVRGPITSHPAVDSHLKAGAFHVFPMHLREHPIGVLLVAATDDLDAARLQSLHSVAGQAAVAMGTTLLCIDRAQRLAVQEERIRIAREIHDTVSQSLFGLAYSLNACTRLLPEQPELVKGELADLQELAEATRAELRHSILDTWPSELTAERFASDLRRHVAGICQADGLNLQIEVRGDFVSVSPRVRRGLYRIAQESLTNVVRHASAGWARVCLEVGKGQALLTVRDNGRGFDPERAMAREFNREHFGLLGIRDRAASLGGSSEIISRPGEGATVTATIPIADSG